MMRPNPWRFVYRASNGLLVRATGPFTIERAERAARQAERGITWSSFYDGGFWRAFP